jgi:hypothetical protein
MPGVCVVMRLLRSLAGSGEPAQQVYVEIRGIVSPAPVRRNRWRVRNPTPVLSLGKRAGMTWFECYS